MRPAVALSAIVALASCHRPQVDAAAEVSTPDTGERGARFEPTAFSVEVHGHGPPVILIPGLGCPATVWRGAVEHLHGYETHSLTLAGFAGKPRIDRPLIETTIEELARYIRERRLTSPVIIGHSLGGFIAYALAARVPQAVGPVVVIDAVAGGDGDVDGARRLRDAWRNASDAQFAQQVSDTFGHMATRADRLRPLLPEIARSDRRAIGDAVFELSTTDVRDHLGAIRAPVLVVLADGGLQDQYRKQAAGVRNREVVVVPNTGHFVMLDDPDRLLAAIDGFLARHEVIAAQ
jgi:pimeloyl-ACP methyl ester carboxylesterase